MNTTATAGTNMAGNQQRLIKAAVRDKLTERFNCLDGASGDQLERNLEAFLADIDTAAVKHSAKAPRLFSSASTYALGEAGGKATSKCFTRSRYTYRDIDFDNWLPNAQRDAPAGPITVLTPEKDWTFREAAVSVLDVSPDTSTAVLGKLLKERSHVMTLTQVEQMIEASEAGKKTGMSTDGWGNFFFVETNDENDPVSVGLVDRGDRRWGASVSQLGDDYRWRAGHRLLVCNLDPSKLGL